MRPAVIAGLVIAVVLPALALPAAPAPALQTAGAALVPAGAGEVVVRVVDEWVGGVVPHYAFDPPMVQVTPGTTVVWENRGDLFHTVTAGVSSTGDAFHAELGGWGDCKDAFGAVVPCSFRHMFSGTGVVMYRCLPHFPLGMVGGVAVG